MPDTWIQVTFNDKDWKDGISGVGFSDNDDNTTTPSALISIWIRYRFNAPNADKIKELVLLADYDDAYIAWLNGVKIASSPGAPTGNPPPWNATAQAGLELIMNHLISQQESQISRVGTMELYKKQLLISSMREVQHFPLIE